MLDLIVNAGRVGPDSPTLRGALALARRQQAFLTGLELVTVYPTLLAVPDAIALLAEAEKEACDRRDWWLGLCREAGIAGDWEVIRGIHVEALAKRSRLADFVIGELRISDPDAPAGLDEITRTLFADAAPMLLIPDVWHHELHIERVLIAWNGSAEAAHAVKAALPLLAQASVVHVLDGERAGLPGISAAAAVARMVAQAWYRSPMATVPDRARRGIGIARCGPVVSSRPAGDGGLGPFTDRRAGPGWRDAMAAWSRDAAAVPRPLTVATSASACRHRTEIAGPGRQVPACSAVNPPSMPSGQPHGQARRSKAAESPAGSARWRPARRTPAIPPSPGRSDR